MNKEALFCDGTDEYVRPPEPGTGQTVRFRFRTWVPDELIVHMITDTGVVVADRVERKGEFDYHFFVCDLTDEPFYYYFEVKNEYESCYYGRCGASEEVPEDFLFKIVPGFTTPNWAKGAVIYQIFTDRFYNGDKTNDVETGEYCYLGEHSERVEDWEKMPAAMDVGRFYGGDLKGVWDKLDYLQKLGVEVIYFNPLFVSPSNHKYDTQDYDYIDPHYGVIVEDDETLLAEGMTDNRKAGKYQKRTTDRKNLEASNEFFVRFSEEVHRRGMKIILDGVFNHCGSFHRWLDREAIYEKTEGYPPGAYASKDSPYSDFFCFADREEDSWPDNDSYEGWWEHYSLPKLNYEGSQKLEEEILRIAAKWVSPPFCADGWRLDVAADLGKSEEYNHLFWEKFRKTVKQANPEAIILAEHYGDVVEWLDGKQWDTVMNYSGFMEPVSWFLTGMEKHSDEYIPDLCGNDWFFVEQMMYHMSRMMFPSLMTSMNQLSNHDHSRFMTRTNHRAGRVSILGAKAAEENINPAVFREGVVMQMTWPGAPALYYGDEAGLCGFTDPDNRRSYPWGNEDEEILSFYREMIRIHKSHVSLKIGSLIFLQTERNILAYARMHQAERVVVIINNGAVRREVTVPVWLCEAPLEGCMTRMIYSYAGGYTTEYEEYIVEKGEVVANMGPYSALVLKG